MTVVLPKRPPVPMLVVGPFGAATLQALRVAADESAFALTVARHPSEALAYARSTSPKVILMSTELEGVAALCTELRQGGTRSSTVLGLANDVGELTVAEFLGSGGDDVVSLDALDELVPRLRAARERKTDAPLPMRGIAIIADGDPGRRTLAARALRGAGYEVRFAGTAEELDVALGEPWAVCYVGEPSLPTGGALATLTRVRDTGRREPWVIGVPPREFAAMRQAASGLGPVAFHDTFTPHENVLFLTNELSHGRGTEARSSPRLLYGTRCWLRAAGSERDVIGFTYNVSEAGLYVRTLYPFRIANELWLEMTPPRTERRVRLEVKVIWRGPVGNARGASVPTGIGVHVEGGSVSDLERYARGCRALAAELGEA